MRPLLALAFLSASGAFGQVSVLTYHNDQARDGWNANETTLTTSNVNQTNFGKLFSNAVDGEVYGQPLYVPNVNISGGTHNVVYVTTEHDSVYAFDADSAGVTYWHNSYIGGVTMTVSQADVGGCPQITPEIGITDTPVIDPATGTIYFAAMTKTVSGGVTTFTQTLHAVDISTGAEKFNGPQTIAGSFPGTGDGGTTVTFVPQAYKERCALTLVNGVVYTSWASHCDFDTWGTYRGWVMGYNASNITQQVSVYCDEPNGSEASFWESGDGPSVDAAGNLYFLSGNGSFDQTAPVSDYGQCFLKLNTTGNAVTALDYFSPMNEATLSSGDQDIGSAGQCLLPSSWGSVAHPNLVIGADKPGDLYVVDTANMGHFSATMNNIPQMVVSIGGSGFTTPAIYSNGVTNYVYWGMTNQALKAFTFANAQYVTVFSSKSATTFGGQGTEPSVSSNGSTNGIVWTIQNGTPLVLHAYDATNLATELYNSGQAAGNRDSAVGAYVKFTTPSIANGKVFVPTGSSLVVYGLLANPTPTVTRSPTQTATSTATSSLTFSPTLTPTKTITATPSSTPTFTPSNSPSSTRASTPTGTPSATATSSATASSTKTATTTPSSTTTNTPINTPTHTPTATMTSTPTVTASYTPSSTPTLSPTGTLSPSNTPTITATPTSTQTLTPTATPSTTPTLTATNSPTSTTTASTTLSATTSSTPTSSPTLSWTPSATLTATPSASPTPSPTSTYSPTLTPTSPILITFTPSPSPTPTSSLLTPNFVLYPNPVKDGNSVDLVLTLTNSASVHLKIFTTSFRKVLDQTTDVLPAGNNNLSITLVDMMGHPLANGLYYLVVEAGGQRSILKLLIER